MREINGVLFDKDGTLFDFAATWIPWAEQMLLRISGGDPKRAAQIGAAIGFDLKNRQFDRDSIAIAGTPGQIVRALAPHFPQHSEAAIRQMLDVESAKAPQQEAVPLRQLLQELRASGLRLGVATNDAEQPARVHLAAAGVEDAFDFIAGFDSGYGGKPDPGQLLAFAQTTGIPPAQIVMVGDSLHDLAAAKAAGMIAVAVLTGPATEADLAPHADVVLRNVGHLPAWLAAGQPAT